MGCAVSIKQAVEVREKYPDVEVHVYYMDIRTNGLWESLYWRSMSEQGIHFVRGRVGQITLAPGGRQLLATAEDTLLGRPTEVPFDLIVLATGMEPGPGTTEAARLFRVTAGPEGFLRPRAPDRNPVETTAPGIFCAGAATGPKAISDSVTEGMGAALLAYRYARG
jgi:heterodisulfide reductase subunit A